MQLGRQKPTPGRLARFGRGVLRASAAPVNSRGGAAGLRKLSQPWHQRAMEYYDMVGECWYPAQSYARAMQKIRWYPAILNDQGEPEEVEDGPLVDLFERVRDPGGASGKSELAGAYGQLMFLIGDGYCVVSTEDDDEQWEFLSPMELRVKPDSGAGRPQEYQRIRAPGATPEELVEASDDDFEPVGEGARVWRFWRRHPMHTTLSDSPVKGVLDLYELLHRLTLAAAAESQSRAAQRGLLFVPEEITVPPLDPGDPGEDPNSDPLLDRLLEGMTTAIQDPGAASAMAPFVLRGPGSLQTPTGAISMAEAIKWLALGPGDRYLEVEAWEKTIERIGNGLDLPREFVTTTVGDTNHWGGWLLDEQQFRQHVAPIAQRFCDDLTSAYLRPAAIEAQIENADRVVVFYDPAEAVNHPDQIKTAKEAYLDGIIGPSTYRDAAGYTDEDAPTDEELELLFAILGKTAPGEEPPAGETPPEEGGRGGDVIELPPDQDESKDERRNGDRVAVAASVARVLGAAEMQVRRGRELAGSRLVRRSQSCAECKDKIRDVHASLVASALGAEQVRSLIEGHISESSLVEGAGPALADQLRQWGMEGEFPEKLGEMVEQHALRTLYTPSPPPLPPGFQSAVSKALA